MKNQYSFSFGARNELLDSYEQSNSPVLRYETPESFDTPAPEATAPIAPAEKYPNEIEHEAAARVLGLGYSIQGMRGMRLGDQGDNRG